MQSKAEALIQELVSQGHDYSKSKFAVYRAINLFPDVNKFDEEFVKRHAYVYINKNKNSVAVNNKLLYTQIEQKNNTRSIRRVVGGSSNFNKSFWDQENAIQLAVDDNEFVDAQPKGNYFKTKYFLRTDWAHVESFMIVDLQKQLTEKYPEDLCGGVFNIQRWGDGIYNANNGQLLVKPLWKKLSYQNFANIFYQEL